MPVNTSTTFTLKELKTYRAFVFPTAVAQKNHIPYFSLDNDEIWTTPHSREIYQAHLSSNSVPEDVLEVGENHWERETTDTIKLYCNFILPPQTAILDFFALDNAESWINDSAFRVFLQHFRSPNWNAAVHCGTAPIPHNGIKLEPQGIKVEPVHNQLKKRKAEVICISSDDDDDDHTSRVVKTSKQVKKDTRKSQSISRRDTKQVAHKRIDRKSAIRITKKDSVSKIEHISSIPTIWSVSPTSKAYLIDLGDDESLVESKSIISMIRHDEQLSWSGSSGHAEGDAFVLDHFGAGPVRARRADLKCNGIKVCEYIDPVLLDGFEGWERDDSEMTPFWSLELDRNESEFSDPDGPLARFYVRVQDSKCAITCNGKPMIRKLKSKSIHGKNTFIGCTGWRQGDPPHSHRYLSIDKCLDEALVAFMIKNNGKLPGNPDDTDTPIKPDGTCTLILHPRSHKLVCPFTHVINGSVMQAKIRPHESCKSRLIIFEPIDQTIRKAIVIPHHSHNHPCHPHSKPTLKEKAFVKAASRACGATQVTAKKLRISATTASLLGPGNTWETQVPAMVDDQRLRRFLNTVNKETYPRGLDWEGVLYEVSNRESQLSPAERYIHTVTTKGDIRLVVAMHPAIVKHIHGVRYLALDYTFKRVRGDMNEWEIAGNIDRYKTRVTFGSLYCNKATQQAFRLIFQEFFDVILRITGTKLTFTSFNPEAKLRALLFDAEPAQMQACGDVLLQMNNPAISGINEQDPLLFVQYFTKTCVQHFYRNIDELSKNIPRDVINRIKSFPSLDSEEDIEAFHDFCRSTPYQPLTNWYKQKLAHPWYLPSVNRFLSAMKQESWDITPNDTNIAESAHAARNADTGIKRPLLSAILDACLRDNQIATRLDHFEKFSLKNRWNGPLEREKKNASRRATTQKKVASITSAREKHDALEAQVTDLLAQRKQSLERKAEITEQLSEIQLELTQCSGVSMMAEHLKAERSALKINEKQGIDARKQLAVSLTHLKTEIKHLKDHELKNSRVRDTRSPTSSPAQAQYYPLQGQENPAFVYKSPTRAFPTSPLKQSSTNLNEHKDYDTIYGSDDIAQTQSSGYLPEFKAHEDFDDIYGDDEPPVMPLATEREITPQTTERIFARFFEQYPTPKK